MRADEEFTPKKRQERYYIEEARCASSIFPTGKLVPFEKPDFLLHSDKGTIGIELTELCAEEARAQGGKLQKVASKAQEMYSRKANVKRVDVGAAFVPHPERVGLQQLVEGLVSFVNSHDKGVFGWDDYELPEGYCYIAILDPPETAGGWHIAHAFGGSIASKELIDNCLRKKNKRLPEYRAAADEVWLLIVNDQFLGAGEVYARADHLAKWSFDFDFDKVLLFSRELGSKGEVIELSKAT